MQKLIVLLGFILLPSTGFAQTEDLSQSRAHYQYFLDLFRTENSKDQERALRFIEQNWDPSFEIFALESLYFLNQPKSKLKLLLLLQKSSGQNIAYDYNAWFEYLWNKPENYNADYYQFKAILHRSIDFRFADYFLGRSDQSEIRLDEVRWGGVKQDGIPPLRNPQMIPAEQADYLDDNNIVFGISINGDTRAYPKRILAWHEMFTDTVGGVPVAGVYCTLCGTVILYKTQYEGTQYNFGTSGFLYRSNKLMYDQKTQSLWNTLWGRPVIGPLVGQDIQLEYLNVVTTTWKQWKQMHPDTQVLSTNTGHRRDYGEGVAYKDYFATDELMFNIPQNDRRLRNKQEILALRDPLNTEEVVAISSKFLKRNRIYSLNYNGENLTIFTDKSGAHRVYRTQGVSFKEYNKTDGAIDSSGNYWTLHEDQLYNEFTGESLALMPAHNAFWFGFKAAFPNTKLIK
ncbi:DUF3179 domain-containing protein [Gilvibacter sp.]|uniref:DUF3179 domain-containing protein n=1 Tax=Gilvibacter sp. TaxID=2729997 RepID=UPI003F4A7B0E